MKILVLNLGSTSFKFKLYEINTRASGVSCREKVLAFGSVENVGANESPYKLRYAESEENGKWSCPGHLSALELCLEFLFEKRVILSLGEVDAIGYKAAHGGPVSGARIVNDSLIDVMDDFASFAPAHNPVYTETMRLIRARYPKLCQAVYFETSFHATIPDYRTTYGVPYEWIGKYGIRRYGFHGSSHSYIAGQMQALEPSAKRIISMHLGGSSSLCAIKDGISIAESMGATPQSGVFHNNRVGDLDVFCIPGLVKQYNGDIEAVFTQLATKGGFLGISGLSNDLRDILKAQSEGNYRADLAVKAFVDSIIGYIGMFTAYLSGVDALVFTGGIGQHSPEIREMVCQRLDYLGVRIDEEKNIEKRDRRISSEQSAVSVWVIETNEELTVARHIVKLLQQGEEAKP